MNKVNKLIAGFLFAGMLASLSALAEENAVPQGNEGNGAATEQLKQDRAALKTDKEKLKADRKKLREDRAKIRHARKHKKEKKSGQPAAEQPKS